MVSPMLLAPSSASSGEEEDEVQSQGMGTTSGCRRPPFSYSFSLFPSCRCSFLPQNGPEKASTGTGGSIKLSLH